MVELDQLLKQNKGWAQDQSEDDPRYFDELAAGQSPPIYWLGCSDSRVPPEQILGLEPGEVFTHRNIANLVLGSDVNFLSTLEYAVKALKVNHVIVCGHYGCGGVGAAFDPPHMDYVDDWIQELQRIKQGHEEELSELEGDEASDRLSELNVEHQVEKLVNTSIIQEAWDDSQDLAVHGLMFRLSTGRIEDLGLTQTADDADNG